MSKRFIAVRFNTQSLENNSPLEIGLYDHYRESVTKQKITGYGNKIQIQADPLLKKVFQAFDLVEWGIPKDGNLIYFKTIIAFTNRFRPQIFDYGK